MRGFRRSSREKKRDFQSNIKEVKKVVSVRWFKEGREQKASQRSFRGAKDQREVILRELVGRGQDRTLGHFKEEKGA